MSLIVDLLKEVFPTIKDALKNSFQAFRTTRRKRQHIFVLKAITRPSNDRGLSVLPTEGRRYDLATIDGKLYRAHLEAVVGGPQKDDAALPLLAVEQEQFRKQLKAVQKRYGLPKLHDPKRAKKIEAILHDMEDKLRFHPPNFWSIK